MAYLNPSPLEHDASGDVIKAHVAGGIGYEAINSAVQLSAAGAGVVAKLVSVGDDGPCLVYTADYLLRRAAESGGILSSSAVAVRLATLAQESHPDQWHDKLRGSFAAWIREYVERKAVLTASSVAGQASVALETEFSVWGYGIDEYLSRLATRKEEYFPLATWSVIAHRLGCCITVWKWSRGQPVVEKVVFSPLDLVVPCVPDSICLSAADAKAEYERLGRLKYSSDLKATIHVGYIGEHFCPIEVTASTVLEHDLRGSLADFPETGYVDTFN